MPNGQLTLDQQPVSEPEAVIMVKPKTPFYRSPKFLGLGVTLFLIFFLIGLALARFSPLFKPKPTSGFPISQGSKLPVSLDLLQNPLLSNWSAHLEGRIAQKTAQSFIISNVTRFTTATGSSTIKDSNDGKLLEIIYIPGKTVFRQTQLTKTKEQITQIDFANLEVGFLVNGTVEIYKKDNLWYLIGKDFTVRKNI